MAGTQPILPYRLDMGVIIVRTGLSDSRITNSRGVKLNLTHRLRRGTVFFDITSGAYLPVSEFLNTSI